MNDPRLLLWWPRFGIEGQVRSHNKGTDSAHHYWLGDWRAFFADFGGSPPVLETMRKGAELVQRYYPAP